MKIAIKGHPTRGKEVIQIFESLGGKNRASLKGDYKSGYYGIYEDTIMILSDLKGYKRYNLEKFEKEFPFKIGDKVKHISLIGIIKEYCYINNEPAYKVESIELGIIAIPSKILKPYKEMQERNITLTLDKAKEWYRKGGELKEVALQAYSEEELTKAELPKSWEEFCEKYPVKKGECVLESEGRISATPWNISIRRLKTWIPSKKSAEAHLAMIQLEQLRDCWRQSWKPDWNNDQQSKYCIGCYQEKFKVSVLYTTKRFLSFPTIEMAEEFLKCFRGLIEKAGDLI